MVIVKYDQYLLRAIVGISGSINLNGAIDSDIKVLNHVLLTLASVGQIVGNY